MFGLFANSGDPDQTPLSVASDLGMRCLPVTRLGIPSLQWLTIRTINIDVGTSKSQWFSILVSSTVTNIFLACPKTRT